MQFPEETFYFFDLSHPASIGKNQWEASYFYVKHRIQLGEGDVFCFVNF